MPHVAALARYPVKGFAPEPLAVLDVQADGRVVGDRVLAFRFADAVAPEDDDGLDYWPKSRGLALQDFPSLAALRVDYDREALRLSISHEGASLVEAGLDPDGRSALEDAVTAFLLDSDDARRLRRPGRMPLSLLGDGLAARFQDRPRGFVTLHGAASARAVGVALGQEIDDRRFRSNIVIDGADAWDELAWSGEVRIGGIPFTIEQPLGRCLATHANPDTGIRDAKVLTTLTGALGRPEPVLGIAMLPVGDSRGRVGDRGSATEEVIGRIRVGDEVEVG